MRRRPKLETALKNATEIQNQVTIMTDLFKKEKKEQEIVLKTMKRKLKALVQAHEAKLVEIQGQPEFLTKSEMKELTRELEEIEGTGEILNALGYRKTKEEEQ